MEDVHLDGFHGGKGCIVGLWRDTCAAGRIDNDGDVRQCRFGDDGIGEHADIGAETDKLDGCNDRGVFLLQQGAEGQRTEGGLIDDGVAGVDGQAMVNLPACGVLEAVGDWQMPALFRLQIVRVVGVAGKNQDVAVLSGGFDLLAYRRDDGSSFLGAKGAIDEIGLHIYDDQNLFRTHLFPVLSDVITAGEIFVQRRLALAFLCVLAQFLDAVLADIVAHEHAAEVRLVELLEQDGLVYAQQL